MKKNILNLYEGFFDDLDQLNKNQDDGFSGINRDIYDKYNYILSQDRNPEFFEGLCKMCKDSFPKLPSNKNGFTQEDLDKITYIDCDELAHSFFENVISLNELQYFHNLEEILSYSFYNCEKLKSVIFPENLKKINSSVFSYSSLKEIIFPKNIKKISKFSFENCKSLEKIIIPKKFKNSIFYGVDLTKVNITYI